MSANKSMVVQQYGRHAAMCLITLTLLQCVQVPSPLLLKALTPRPLFQDNRRNGVMCARGFITRHTDIRPDTCAITSTGNST